MPNTMTALNQLALPNANLNIEEVKELLAQMTTEGVVDAFVVSKQVSANFASVEKAARDELNARRSEGEGGTDAKGNALFGGNTTAGIKVVRRVAVGLNDDAVQRLTDLGYGDMLPRVPVLDRMLQQLKKYGVPVESYTEPSISLDDLNGLLERGVIDADLAISLTNHKESWAFTVQKEKAK